MSPNFCSYCGHRIFQHGSEGCEHVDISPNQPSAGVTKVPVRTPCDCTIPHPLLVCR